MRPLLAEAKLFSARSAKILNLWRLSLRYSLQAQAKYCQRTTYAQNLLK